MVSLFDISTQRPLWTHLSTGVPTLDQMLSLQSDALLDFQSVPGNASFSAMLCNLIASHLSSSPASKCVVLETLNAFPWQILSKHPSFDESWIDSGRLVTFSAPTFAQLYAFLTFMPLSRTDAGSVLLLVTNFHELVEFYRLQMSALHEETLLKHQIDKNRCYLENMPKVAEEGLASVNLPPAPPIACENPYTKVQNHINGLVSMMSEYAFKNSAVVILIGHLEPKFKSVFKKESLLNVSSDPSIRSSQLSVSQNATPSFNRDSSRLTLQPVTLGPGSAEKPALSESKLTARVVFYNDWFHKSPYFQKNCRKLKRNHRFFVTVAKVSTFGGINNINEPVYFCHGANQDVVKQGQDTWMIDLSEPEKEEEALASLIQNSISSTHIAMRNSPGVSESGENPGLGPETHRRKVPKVTLPSSPTHFGDILQNQRLDLLLRGEENDTPKDDPTDSDHEDTEDSEIPSSSNENELGEESDAQNSSSVHTEDENEAENEESASDDEDAQNPMNMRRGERDSSILDINQNCTNPIPELVIMEEHEHSYIDGSDVESTGTLLEDMDNSDAEWLARHS